MKTAVEWLVDYLKSNCDYNIEGTIFFEQAKEMEKEQMIDFLDSIMDHTKESHNILGVSDDREAKDYFEQYYNETFKSE